MRLNTNDHVAKVLMDRMETFHSKVMIEAQKNNTWVKYTGKQVSEQVNKVSIALLNEGVKHQNNIAIYSQNMAEWTFADLGVINIGCVPVPIYATNIAEQAQYIVNDASVNILFVGEKEQYEEVLKFIDDETLAIKKVIVFDETVELSHPKTTHYQAWINQYNTSEFEASLAQKQEKLSNKDIATIIYTSGTTGNPKGVVLTHENLIANCINHDLKYDLSDQDSSLSFLPLSHVYERIWTYYVFHKGMKNTYNKDPKDIAEVIKEVKPTVMCSVPRLYEKIYDLIYTKLAEASLIKKGIFKWSISIGKKVEQKRNTKNPISGILRFKYKLANKLVLSKIREQLGGNLKFMPCGGAFLTDEVTSFFRAVGLPIVIGYGLTETSATVTAYDVDSYSLGTVGKPIPNVEVKIGNNNEILVRGKSVMQGYYKLPEETEKVFEGDWFKTGDAGELDQDGNLIITDRIKDLIKTSGGKYIAPQHVEGTIAQNYFVEQISVIGEGRPFPTALISPNFEAIEFWAKENQVKFSDKLSLLKSKEVLNKFQKILEETQKTLANFEKVKKFKLMTKEFTVEDGEMTPTFKLKRKIIAKKYSSLIEEMYS